MSDAVDVGRVPRPRQSGGRVPRRTCAQARQTIPSDGGISVGRVPRSERSVGRAPRRTSAPEAEDTMPEFHHHKFDLRMYQGCGDITPPDQWDS